MRFCVFSTQQRWGGGETLVWTLAQELSQLGHDVSWVVRSGSEVEKFVDRQGALVAHRPVRRLGGPRSWWNLSRALRKESPDVLLLNDTHSVMQAASGFALMGKPKPCRLAYKHTVFPLRSPLKYRLLCDKLICVSHAARDVVVQGGVSPKHVQVIHGGCPIPDISSFDPGGIRTQLGLAANERLLVSVGNLLDCKGHADLVQAVAELHAEIPLRLVIAGQGEERAVLERQISQLGLSGKVQLLGYRNDAEQLLHAADLVVHPSHAEGLSLVLIQAQMLGKPIVATPVGGTVEVLGACDPLAESDPADRLGTWLARPNDPGSLADAVKRALEQLAEQPEKVSGRLAQVAESTQQQFSIRSSAESLTQTAGELLALKNR